MSTPLPTAIRQQAPRCPICLSPACSSASHAETAGQLAADAIAPYTPEAPPYDGPSCATCHGEGRVVRRRHHSSLCPACCGTGLDLAAGFAGLADGLSLGRLPQIRSVGRLVARALALGTGGES